VSAQEFMDGLADRYDEAEFRGDGEEMRSLLQSILLISLREDIGIPSNIYESVKTAFIEIGNSQRETSLLVRGIPKGNKKPPMVRKLYEEQAILAVQIYSALARGNKKDDLEIGSMFNRDASAIGKWRRDFKAIVRSPHAADGLLQGYADDAELEAMLQRIAKSYNAQKNKI